MMVNCPSCGRWYDDSFPKCTNCGHSSFDDGGEVFYVPPPPPEISAMGGHFPQQHVTPPPASHDINAPNYVPGMGVPVVEPSVPATSAETAWSGQTMPFQSVPVSAGAGVSVPCQPTDKQGVPASISVPSAAAVPVHPPREVTGTVFTASMQTGKKSKAPLIALAAIALILLIGGIAAGIYFASRHDRPFVETDEPVISSSVSASMEASAERRVPSAAAGGTR